MPTVLSRLEVLYPHWKWNLFCLGGLAFFMQAGPIGFSFVGFLVFLTQHQVLCFSVLFSITQSLVLLRALLDLRCNKDSLHDYSFLLFNFWIFILSWKAILHQPRGEPLLTSNAPPQQQLPTSGPVGIVPPASSAPVSGPGSGPMPVASGPGPMMGVNQGPNIRPRGPGDMPVPMGHPEGWRQPGLIFTIILISLLFG